jgi:hypothetical protein
MAQTPREAADLVYTAIPHSITPDLLSDYGLEVTPDQARHIAQELLSLNLYWIGSALQANLRPEEVGRIKNELKQRIEQGWRELGMQGSEPSAVFTEAKVREANYHQIIQEGGSPISVFGQSAQSLEFEGAVEAGQHQKLLALFIDLVPVDTFGELLDSLELTDS